MSVFGRLTYNYDQRYLFETTMRYDGSSRFPTDNKFGFFPSVAVGWRLSEEQFFKEAESLSFIDNLKLKASYGIEVSSVECQFIVPESCFNTDIGGTGLFPFQCRKDGSLRSVIRTRLVSLVIM